MAATTSIIVAKDANGREYNISLYNAANAAVDTFLPCAVNGNVAVAGSKTSCKPGKWITIKDYIAGAASGSVSVEVNGTPISVILDSASFQASNAGRRELTIPLGPADEIAFRVNVVFPA